jgi:hypothetical protein
MFQMKSFLAKLRRRARPIEEAVCEFPRRLRSFDAVVIAPYDDEGVVAFLKASKLRDLSTDEIRVYLAIMDWAGVLGLTESWIAEHLELAPYRVRSSLRHLECEQYIMPSGFKEDGGNPRVAWICNPDELWSDPEILYLEFALL